MPPHRPKKGARRIDAAIDHFTPMGYATADIRTVVKELLKVYGDDGWPFLEEGSYRVVQEALFDKEEQLQLQLLQQEEEQEHQQPQKLEEAPIENNMPIVEMHEVPAEAEPTVEEMQEALFQKQKEEQLQLQLLQQEEEQEDQQAQQLEVAIHEAPLESNMPIVEVYEVPAETDPIVDEVDPMLVDEPATVICGTRRPCYGWLIEYVSDSDTEEEMHVPSQESLPCKRKMG